MDRNDFEFTFEKAQKVPPDWLFVWSNAQSSGVPGVVSRGGGANTAGREADHVCRSTAWLKIPVFGPTYVVMPWCVKEQWISAFK
jgi:hypothetical protein